MEMFGIIYVVIFFFKQKTAYEIKECDWSSDVCSSDLLCSWNRVLNRIDKGRIRFGNFDLEKGFFVQTR